MQAPWVMTYNTVFRVIVVPIHPCAMVGCLGAMGDGSTVWIYVYLCFFAPYITVPSPRRRCGGTTCLHLYWLG